MLDLPSIEYLFSNNPRVPTINAILVVSINNDVISRIKLPKILKFFSVRVEK